jgi:hypothetical protein
MEGNNVNNNTTIVAHPTPEEAKRKCYQPEYLSSISVQQPTIPIHLKEKS